MQQKNIANNRKKWAFSMAGEAPLKEWNLLSNKLESKFN
jgi:hypothetical protein